MQFDPLAKGRRSPLPWNGGEGARKRGVGVHDVPDNHAHLALSRALMDGVHVDGARAEDDMALDQVDMARDPVDVVEDDVHMASRDVSTVTVGDGGMTRRRRHRRDR